MKIVIITTDSYFSRLLMSELVEEKTDQIVSIVITPSRVRGKGLVGSVRHVYDKTGLKNLIYKVVGALWVYCAECLYNLGMIKHCITPTNLAKAKDIELFISSDCNDDRTYKYLALKDVDIIFSINVYQRIKRPLLELPKIAAVNNHFGLLPKYKGMAPYIWAMAKGENQIGLTIHHMAADFDEGELILQEKISVEAGDSAMGVYLRGCGVATTMINEAVNVLEKDKNYGIAQKGEGSYFSMPTRECVRDFYARGYKLWTFKDLFKILSATTLSTQPNEDACRRFEHRN